ncbi:sensor histidine kinase [Nonomuraea sp. H19]|uniref:sensor histidine kinase n=1 Tax=Nonomuraea sp. H19 TaxID=3452206 RepID=UPI003F8B7084
MAAEERRLWRQYVLDVLRPEEQTARPSRRALVTDVLLAIVLTVTAVAAVASFRGGDQSTGERPPHLVESLQLRPTPPARPADPTAPSQNTSVDRPSNDPHPLLVILTTLPLAARRRYPLTTFWVVLLAALATSEGATWITVLACAIAAYSAVAHSRHRAPAMAGLVAAAVLAGTIFRGVAPVLPSWLGPFVVLLSAGGLAGFVRFWQRRLRAGRDRLTQLQQDQEDAMHRAVEEERSRMAGELHDIVTHNVSVMVIQAGAARKVMDAEPEESKRALLAIEASGRAAMGELRHVMGLLSGSDSGRPDGSGEGLEPQPGLDRLDALVDRVRAAGIGVSVAMSPPPDPLPPGVDLTAYRVVQEALTNTIKHAAHAEASVTIGHSGDWLEIEVADTGGAQRNSSRTGGGRGLIGLRERLAVYGGTLDAGRRPGGGYRVKARVPWRAT